MFSPQSSSMLSFSLQYSPDSSLNYCHTGHARALRIDLEAEAKAAKAELQNVKAEITRTFFEPKPQNIQAKSLELQNFPVYIFQMSNIFVFALGSIHHFHSSIVPHHLNCVCFMHDNYANFSHYITTVHSCHAQSRHNS